jgi:hypothetical protein
MRNGNDKTGNSTGDSPVCSAVLQPTAPPCRRYKHTYFIRINCNFSFNLHKFYTALREWRHIFITREPNVKWNLNCRLCNEQSAKSDFISHGTILRKAYHTAWRRISPPSSPAGLPPRLVTRFSRLLMLLCFDRGHVTSHPSIRTAQYDW